MSNEDYLEVCAKFTGEVRYFAAHRKQFPQALNSLPPATDTHVRAFQVGPYGFFLNALGQIAGNQTVNCGIFEGSPPHKVIKRAYAFGDGREELTIYNANLKYEFLPIGRGQYEIFLALKILERMPFEPARLIGEINRLLKFDGHFFLITLNASDVCYAENIVRIFYRQLPNSFNMHRSSRNQGRHSREYGTDVLTQLMASSGFAIERIWTENLWFEECPELVKWIEAVGYPIELRGDHLSVQAVKTLPLQECFPGFL